MSAPPPESHADREMHSMKSLNKSIKDINTILPKGNQKMIAEKHRDEKLAIALLVVGTGLIFYHLWQKKYVNGNKWQYLALREKCTYSELFWSVFFRMRENTGQNNSEYGHFLRSVGQGLML